MPQCDTHKNCKKKRKEKKTETLLVPLVTQVERISVWKEHEREREKLCLEMLIVGLKYLYVSSPKQW